MFFSSLVGNNAVYIPCIHNVVFLNEWRMAEIAVAWLSLATHPFFVHCSSAFTALSAFITTT